jgi:hypothetical protein
VAKIGNTMRLGVLTVTCKVIGEEMQPWGKHGGMAFKYKVTVRHSAFKSASYTANAWGSQHDYSQGKHSCDSIGAMVVDELLSAASDPDEFMDMVVGHGEDPGAGKDIVKRVKAAEKTIKAAKQFRHEELARAVEEAQEKGLL